MPSGAAAVFSFPAIRGAIPAILLLAFCAFVVFIRHRERKGKPVWTTLEDTAGASVVPAPRQAMELTATAGRNVSRGAEP